MPQLAVSNLRTCTDLYEYLTIASERHLAEGYIADPLPKRRTSLRTGWHRYGLSLLPMIGQLYVSLLSIYLINKVHIQTCTRKRERALRFQGDALVAPDALPFNSRVDILNICAV
jgi:hypothetical protein